MSELTLAAAPIEETVVEEILPQSPEEANILGWADKLGLDPKELLDKYKAVEESDEESTLVMDISTETGVQGFLDSTKVEKLLKKKHWAFFYSGRDPQSKIQLQGVFAGHVPSRQERVRIGLIDSEMRGGANPEVLDGETLIITRGTAMLKVCVDVMPPWFKLDDESTSMMNFIEIVGEVRERTESFRF